ncbi:MAG: three-Cys-motif partner protein TcmP [Dehalococcoidia bacterium]
MVQKIPRPIGFWTARKLEQLSAYLDAFAKATTRAGERYYIDAMAGCGECVAGATGAPVPGSAWRAVNAKPQFTGIHLVELDRRSAAHLANQMSRFENVHVHQGDCNVVIPRDVLPHVSRIAPTLAFLDPTGVQPSWALVEQLARHRRGTAGRKIELLILFAFDMFINRWLVNERLWSHMDSFFGDQRWRKEWEESKARAEAIDERRMRFMHLYMSRLRDDLGYKHVEPHGPLKKGNRVLYHMIFATDHDDAKRIMADVWKKDRAIPGDMFYQRTFEFEPPASAR